MQVILLERVERLGNMGDVVSVKPGFARNFLLPRAKALRATKDNIAFFDGQKKHLETDNQKRKEAAEKMAKKVGGITVNVIRQASEGGQLYGSVTARDIAEVIAAKSKEKVEREMVRMDRNYKMLGLFPIKVILHPEVIETITINIARSEEEAKVQLKQGRALVTGEREMDLKEKAVKAVETAEAELAAVMAPVDEVAVAEDVEE